jgi:hypothetical protein
MFGRHLSSFVFPLIAVLLLAPLGSLHAQQKMDRITEERLRQMLRDAYDNVQKNYYDPKIHGFDWDARYHQFQEKMKRAVTLGQGLTVVAGFLEALNDSHTFFQPP